MSDEQNREQQDSLNSVEEDDTRTVKIPANNDDDHITTLKLAGNDNLIRSSERLTEDPPTHLLLGNKRLPLDSKDKADDRIRLHAHPLEPQDTARQASGDKSTRNDPLIGEVFADKYEILSVAGRGGMSTVYKALHTALNKVVAIKVLLTHLAQNEKNLRRFKQEAQVVSHLDHPGIVSLFDFGETAEGQPYLILEFLRGQPLSTQLGRQAEPMSIDDALNYFIQLCEALSHAHKLGVIHRDLKPSNIFVEKNRDGRDQLKITDFGIAKLCGDEDRFDGQKLTSTGDVFGSPLYMSPEQCTGATVDQRSDIYSLGCVMYEVITGQPPHAGATAYETMQKHVSEDTEFPGNLRPEIRKYGDLEFIMLKAIAHKREKRYQSADELLVALQHVHKNSPFDLFTSVARAFMISRMRSKSKLLNAVFGIAAAVSIIALLLVAANWTTVQDVYKSKTGVPQLQSKAAPGSWRKVSEEAQQLINDGKFKAARPLLGDAERIARKTNDTEQLLITLEKQAFIAHIFLEKSTVKKLLAEIDTLHEKFDSERAGSEELRLLLEAFNANPDNPVDEQKAKFDELSGKLIEWSRRLIRSKRYPEARNVLDTLTDKLEKVPDAPEANRLGARLAVDELAVFQYRDPDRRDKKHDTWRNFQSAHEDLHAMTEPKEEEGDEASDSAGKTESDSSATESEASEAGTDADTESDVNAETADTQTAKAKPDGIKSSAKPASKEGGANAPAPLTVPASALSQEDFMWAITLRAYVNAVLHSTTDPTIETSYKEAFDKTAKQSLDYYTTSGAKSPHAALAYMLVADGMDKEYKRKTANDLYGKALPIFTEKGNARDASHCYTEIANNLVEMRKPMEALSFLHAALKNANESPVADEFLLANLYASLGKVYWHENNLASAVDSYLNEARILQEITPPEEWLDLLNDVAEVYNQKSSVDDTALAKAEPFCLQWLAILEVNEVWETEPLQKLRWISPIDAVKERLCYIYMNTKKHALAEKLFKERMDSLYKQQKNEVPTFTVWFPDLVQRYLVRRYERRQFLNRIDAAAVEAKTQLTRIPLARVLDTYGRCYWNLGEKTKAAEIMQQAAEVAKTYYMEDHYWAHRIILDCRKVFADSDMKAQTAEMDALAQKLNRAE